MRSDADEGEHAGTDVANPVTQTDTAGGCDYPVPTMAVPIARRNRFERHRKKVFVLMLVGVFLAGEVATRVLARHGVVAYRPYPTSRHPEFWADVDEAVGVWHLPNAWFRHASACFDVTYRANSYGARDAERSRTSDAPRRVVVLGDSFVEGFGTDDDDRMTNLIEGATGVEHLNFGTSGHFGPVQEWLLYESLASTFDHTDVFVFLLPDNDFADMNASGFPPDRYRPYLRETGETFEVWYPVAFDERSVPEPQSWLKIGRRHLYNACYLLNAFRTSFEADTVAAEQTVHRPGRCSYAGVSKKRIEWLLFAYDRLVGLTAARRVTIFVIPRLGDLQSCSQPGDAPDIVDTLEAWAVDRPTVDVVDLLPSFIRHAEENSLNYDAYFLPCDAHWSPLGHRVAADAVIDGAHSNPPRHRPTLDTGPYEYHGR